MKLLVPAAVLFVACGPRAPSEQPKTDPEPTLERESVSARPRLVVVVILDQFPATLFPRLPKLLAADGMMAGRQDEARVYSRARYPYAGTSTAPGHASIHTGVPPRVHGIDANDFYDFERDAKITIVDDGEHRVFGLDDVYASPTVLRADTIADRLVARNAGSRVVSVSMKARAAVLSAGDEPDLVAWYDRRTGAATTSSYYGSELPAFLSEWNQDNPLSAHMPTWEADAPDVYQALVGDDDAPGEANWYGLGRTFPHDIAAAADPPRVWMATPASANYLLELATAAAGRYDLGSDDAVDLLCISVSATDYAGHAFGVDSWEYHDVLRQVDRQLASFLDALDKERGPVALVITSDHGGGALPEKSDSGGRIDHKELVVELDRAVDKAVGAGDWVKAFYQPYLNLTPAALGEKRPQVVAAIQAAAAKHEGIHRVVDPVALEEPPPGAPDLERAIWLHPAPGRKHLFVVPAPGYFTDPEREPGRGSNHGTPWDVDREVPIFVWGPGVEAEHVAETVSIFRATEEISRLLGLPDSGS